MQAFRVLRFRVWGLRLLFILGAVNEWKTSRATQLRLCFRDPKSVEEGIFTD